MGEDKKEGRMKKSGVLFVIAYLALEITPRIIEGVDFIHPEGFLIKRIEPQRKASENTEYEDNQFFSFCGKRISKMDGLHQRISPFAGVFMGVGYRDVVFYFGHVS